LYELRGSSESYSDSTEDEDAEEDLNDPDPEEEDDAVADVLNLHVLKGWRRSSGISVVVTATLRFFFGGDATTIEIRSVTISLIMRLFSAIVCCLFNSYSLRIGTSFEGCSFFVSLSALRCSFDCCSMRFLWNSFSDW
jgi:hypothetical protein